MNLNGVFIAGEVDLTMGKIASLIIPNAMHTFNDCCLRQTKEERFDQLKRMFDTNNSNRSGSNFDASENAQNMKDHDKVLILHVLLGNIAKTPIQKYKSKILGSGHFKFLTYGSIRFDKSYPWEVSNNSGRCY